MERIKIMKYYKNTENEIFAFEDDGSQDHLITDDMVEINEAEKDQIVAKNNPLTWDDIRFKRNVLLSENDNKIKRYHSKVRLGKTPQDDIAALDAYAEALRDLPQTYGAPGGNPDDVEWPTL